MRASDVVKRLGLERLEREGGWYRRARTDTEPSKARSRLTSIYGLFTADDFSALHRLDADETFFYSAGDPMSMLELLPNGDARFLEIGPNLDEEQTPQHTFVAGNWFGGRPLDDACHGYSLVSAVVSPGFDWEGFELGVARDLVLEYPKFREAILSLTRGTK